MPRMTHQYPFERRVAGGIGGRVEALLELSGPGSSYLLVLQTNGSISLTVYPMNVFPGDTLDNLKDAGERYIFYDPVNDGMEHIALMWQNIDQEMMEKLIGSPFDANDFVSQRTGAARAYPESWVVMF